MCLFDISFMAAWCCRLTLHPRVSEVGSSIFDFRHNNYSKGKAAKIQNRMVNNVDPDEAARNEPSHLALHCLQRYLFWYAGMKGLSETN